MGSEAKRGMLYSELSALGVSELSSLDASEPSAVGASELSSLALLTAGIGIKP